MHNLVPTTLNQCVREALILRDPTSERDNIRAAHQYVRERLDEHRAKIAELEYHKKILVTDYIRVGGNTVELEK